MDYETDKNQSIDKLRIFLLDMNIQPSFHRLKILDYLKKNHIHPTVDNIYKDLSSEIPTLSKTTVYNTLGLFMEHDIVSGLTIDENEVRYDIRTAPHAHFKCIKCQKIMDVDYSVPDLNKKVVNGNYIIESHIYFKGYCAECQNKMQ